MPAKPPKWLREAVIYHIFIDRFHRGAGMRQRAVVDEARPVFCGGNLHGVTEKLRYLADLGVNTLWLSPFNPAPAYHGYHVTDFFGVERRFGGERALQKLLDAAQGRGLRVLMDLVPNHVHRTHPWFQAALTNRRSRYREWFYWRKDGTPLTFLHFDELPKLNLDHPPARAELVRVAKHWLDRGIAGFRLDHAMGPSLDFWRAFRRAVKAQRADAALIGEVAFFGIEPRHLPTLRLPHKHAHLRTQQAGGEVLAATMREYAGVFDGLLDFQFHKLLKLVAHGKRRGSRAAVQRELDRHYAGFPGECVLLSFLDNHDVDRFLFEAGNDRARLERALEIQFAQASPPIIYYGTEFCMTQAKRISGDYGDLQARRLLPWHAPDRKLQKTYRELIRKWKRSRAKK